MNAPLNLQVIRTLSGKPEFVLIPVAVYDALREQIEDEIAGLEAAAEKGGEYVPFEPGDYIDNPVALARMKAGVTQQVLASRLGVSQAYVSKVERQAKVTPKLLGKVISALGRKPAPRRAR